MKHTVKTTCTGKKPDGTRCHAAALPGRPFCFFHDEARASQRREAQSRGGQGNRMRTLPADTPDVPIQDADDVVRLLSATINQTRRGELDPRVANAVGYLANILLTAAGHRDLETRVAQLEALIKTRAFEPEGC